MKVINIHIFGLYYISREKELENNGLGNRIDNIDLEIRALFSERLRISAELVKADAQDWNALFDTEPDRERLEAVLVNTDPPLRGYISEFYQKILEINRSYLGSIINDADKTVNNHAVNTVLQDGAYTLLKNGPVQSSGVNVKNIALIGMPGCGKTTIGRILAENLGWEFCETDEHIARKMGKSINQVYAETGENAFRDMETGVIKEVTKGRGCVIATGDDVIKSEANREALRNNSTVVFIDRTPSELLSDGTVKTDLFALKKIYLERLPVYLDWCECEVTARGGAERTARAIKELMQRKP